MAYCPKCGKEVHEDAEICVHCGCRIKPEPFVISNTDKKAIRFLLTFFLGFVGSYIINHTSLKPDGWTSRTYCYFFLGFITLGIYSLIASICNFSFDAEQSSNIGYIKE